MATNAAGRAGLPEASRRPRAMANRATMPAPEATMNLQTALGSFHQAALGVGTIDYYERGTGRPLVFLHGLAVHAGLWRKVVPLLADRFRCIVPTLPLGAHPHPMSPDADLTPAGLAKIVDDFLAHLGIDDAVIIGNDTGGAIAQVLATAHPQRIGALVLTPCDAFDNFFPWKVRHLQLLGYIPGGPWQISLVLRPAFLRRSIAGFGLLTKHGIDDAVSASFIECLVRDKRIRRDLGRILRGVRRRYTQEAAARLPQFDKPTLIAWATEDKLFPVEHARRLAQLIPNARLELIEDSYSYIPEDQPEKLASAIRSFLG